MMEEKREGRMGQKAEYIGRHVEKSRLISEKRFLGFKHTFEKALGKSGKWSKNKS